MEDGQGLTALLSAIVTGAVTYLVTRTNVKPTLEQHNTAYAKELFEEYKKLNDELKSKVEKMEHELSEIKSKYEKEIAYYKSEVERLEDENDDLRIENEKLRGVI